MERVWGAITRLFVLSILAASAQAMTAAITAPNQVDCFETFKATATLSEGASLMRADFFVDQFLYETKNVGLGAVDATGTFGPGNDWEESSLGKGIHEVRVRFIRSNEVVSEATRQIEVAGRRCQEPSTTTSTSLRTIPRKVNCTLDSECPSTVGEPFCIGDTVAQTLTIGVCAYPGTPQSYCTAGEENDTVEVCSPDRACIQGGCYAQATTTTAAPETTTTTTDTTTTTSTTSPPTTTRPPAPTTTHQPVLARTNTRLDRIIDIIEGMLKVVLYWRQ